MRLKRGHVEARADFEGGDGSEFSRAHGSVLGLRGCGSLSGGGYGALDHPEPRPRPIRSITGGQKMTKDGIVKSFRSTVCEEIDLVPEGLGRYVVSTPFEYDDGDCLEIVLRERDLPTHRRPRPRRRTGAGRRARDHVRGAPRHAVPWHRGAPVPDWRLPVAPQPDRRVRRPGGRTVADRRLHRETGTATSVSVPSSRRRPARPPRSRCGLCLRPPTPTASRPPRPATRASAMCWFSSTWAKSRSRRPRHRGMD